MTRTAFVPALLLTVGLGAPLRAQVAVRGETVYTMAGPVLHDGVVLIGADGKIARVGPAAEVTVPAGVRVLRAKVVTPGLIDAHSAVGVSGWLNQTQDQDQLESSAPIQPELRALDAYNAQDRLVAWVRGFGVTTLHTGHAPGAVVSGETLVVKTRGDTVEAAVVVPRAMVAATLGPGAKAAEGKSPGTRAKIVALLRAELVKAQEYARKRANPEPGKEPEINLRSEALARVLARELPLLVTVERAQDILTALRLAQEFGFKLVLDSAAEGHLVADAIQRAGVPVIVHATMARQVGERENATFENAAKLRAAGIPIALQSGFEAYVPKTRVVLLEAAIAAAHGLSFEQALASITSDAARLLGLEGRIGSLAPGKDGDVALYDGDPFEFTSHCIGVLIDGQVVEREAH
jgi:imidazolonepropionase-like amidohydrolase